MSAPRSRRLLSGLALAAALASRSPVRAQEPDPFYLDLERSGRVALARGDAATASHRLRTACFGLLGEPERLAGCLVRLGLAQSRSGDRDGFARTFERLDGVEERFAVYGRATLDDEERTEFEARLAEWVAPESLALRPAFAPLAWSRLISLARTELDAGRAAGALARLQGIPATAGDGLTGCLRGEALARLERCPDALPAFAACHPESAARFAAPALGCLVAAGRAEDATRLAAGLSDGVRADRQVRRRLAELEAAGARPKPPPARPSP